MENKEAVQPNIEQTDVDLKNNPWCALALFSALNPKNICNNIRKKREARNKQRKMAELRKQQEMKRQQLEKEEKFKLYKEFVKWELENLASKFRINIEKDNERTESRNKTCPNCWGKNVVNRIWNTTWNVHGEVHWSWYVSWWLFYVQGSSHVDWYVKWKTETLPVSHCNDCSNEWIQKSKKSTYDSDIIKEDISPKANLLIWKIGKYLEWEYTDILIDDEKERQEKAFNKLLDESRNYLNGLNGISIETLAYLYSAHESWYWYIDESYQYKFPKNIENVLEKIWFKYGYKG